MKTLYESLHLADPSRPDEPVAPLPETFDAKMFSTEIVQSREFRQYILNGLTLGDLPAAVVCRLLDHAGGKPVDRIEHTGKDGQPIETITEVRRVVVHVSEPQDESAKRYVTH